MNMSGDGSRDVTPSRAIRYATVRKEVLAVVEGETNLIAKMASVASLLHNAFDDFFWTGFYVVDPANQQELVIGPYQGTLGCLRIPFGQGVCGAAAETGEAQIVEDVDAFPGHIACDAKSNSEIVVPVKGANGQLIAVLDIDSERLGAFDEVDARELQSIVDAAFSD